MKSVEWKDSEGKVHISLVRDSDSSYNAEEGISIEPPPFEDILDNAKIELHNELVSRGLFDLVDVSRNQGALESAITKTITKKIVLRYKEKQNNKE